MSAALLAPPRPKAPPAPKLWTVVEFHRVFSVADLRAVRPYLVRGVVWEQGPMNPPHADCVERINALLIGLFADRWRVRPQLPLVLGADTDPVPDFALVRRTPDTGPGHPTGADLIVEVSDTTLYEDQTTKAELYATAGVPEYWIVDVNAAQLIVLRDPRPVPDNGSAYRSVQTLDAGDSVSPLLAPEASIRVADLLP